MYKIKKELSNGKNVTQFQSRYGLFERFNDYGTEGQCAQALFQWKWAGDFSALSMPQRVFVRLKTVKCITVTTVTIVIIVTIKYP
ncbi:MAG: hypothetical protein COB30_010260 [Ectothiorhodospiraceae bacterium]|nr:hypothetical protein [Ectothiorhodospiraceae bacterium]